MMLVLDHQRAIELLAPLGLGIGGWNELRALRPEAAPHKSYSPPTEAIELYVVADRLAQWVASGAWTLLQVDNSTSPTEDEIAVFEKIAFNGLSSWDVGKQHSLLVEGQGRCPTLVLLIYFALLFEWHVYLTSAASFAGQRLALQDGVVYFFGDAVALRSAEALIDELVAAPRQLSEGAGGRSAK